jgi:hypothetical protein
VPITTLLIDLVAVAFAVLFIFDRLDRRAARRMASSLPVWPQMVGIAEGTQRIASSELPAEAVDPSMLRTRPLPAISRPARRRKPPLTAPPDAAAEQPVALAERQEPPTRIITPPARPPVLHDRMAELNADEQRTRIFDGRTGTWRALRRRNLPC